MQLVTLLLGTADRLRTILGGRLAQWDLNEVRYAALAAIDRSAPDGFSQTELALALEQSESSISTLVDRMRVGGLIYRLRSKADRRRHLLMLTARGRELLTRARDDREASQSQLVPGLDAAQARTLVSLLGAWLVALANLHSGPAAGGSPAATPSDEAQTKPTAA